MRKSDDLKKKKVIECRVRKDVRKRMNDEIDERTLKCKEQERGS